mgnify:CR=1 FL=1
MLYNLFSNLVENYPIFNVFKYLTVRTGLSMFTSMIVVFFIGNPIINYFASKKIHNPIRSDGPTDHIVKKIGTPTMGGVLILIGIFSGVLLWSDLSNPYNWFLIFIVGGLGILGAYDDYKKIKSGSSGGVSFRFKIPHKNKLSMDTKATTSGEYFPQINTPIVIVKITSIKTIII